MAKSNKVLSIDITNESITIIELTASAKKQTMIHNIIIFETPEDSYEDGVLKEPEKIAEAITQQLMARGINNKNAIFVLSSTKIVNREVMIPFVPEKKIRGIINSNSSEYFPVNIEDYVVSHSVLETVTDEENNKQLRVLAVAAPHYIGNAMLQLIKTQTNQNTTTMVIQLGSESTVLNIVQGDNLLLQRTVPYGTNSVVNVVMDEKGVDATTAMTLLQNDRLITVDFDDNEVTGAFRYLINNIGRVMDFYASKNPDKPIEDVFLTGDGALIRGIDGLFKVQLNVSTRIMDTLYNIKFDPSIDLKVYNPVYLVTPIGAAFAPMGFVLMDTATQATKAEGSLAPFIALVAVAAIGAAGMAFYSINKKNTVTEKKQQLEADIARVSDIEDIITAYDQAQAQYTDMESMYYTTYQLNENVREFISELEKKIPAEITVSNFNSTNEGVTMPCVSTSYDAIADFIMQLKTIDCVDNAYVAMIQKEDNEGQITYNFTVTVNYVPMMDDPAADTSEDTTEAADTGAEE